MTKLSIVVLRFVFRLLCIWNDYLAGTWRESNTKIIQQIGIGDKRMHEGNVPQKKNLKFDENCKKILQNENKMLNTTEMCLTICVCI